jgi:spore coat polysaccharide biosynthesis protein SpsF
MLVRQIERVARARSIGQLVVATSTEASDDLLSELCCREGVPCYRGSLNDVLDRFHGAALAFGADTVVRLTGDCPLAEPAVIDDAVAFFRKGSYDYVTNALQPTYPHGLDVEVCTFEALNRAWREARLPWQREHVMPFINRQPELFKIGHLKGARDLSSYRLTVDEPQDYEVVRQVFEALYQVNPAFRLDDVLRFLDSRPDLIALNGGHGRNESLARQMAAAPDRKAN